MHSRAPKKALGECILKDVLFQRKSCFCLIYIITRTQNFLITQAVTLRNYYKIKSCILNLALNYLWNAFRISMFTYNTKRYTVLRCKLKRSYNFDANCDMENFVEDIKFNNCLVERNLPLTHFNVTSI